MQVLATPASSQLTMSRPPSRRSVSGTGDEVRLGERPAAELPGPSAAELKGPEVTTMSGWTRGIALGMAGLIGALALTGCTQQTPTTPPVTFVMPAAFTWVARA